MLLVSFSLIPRPLPHLGTRLIVIVASPYTHSLKGNAAIGDEGRKALEEAAKERGITIM